MNKLIEYLNYYYKDSNFLFLFDLKTSSQIEFMTWGKSYSLHRQKNEDFRLFQHKKHARGISKKNYGINCFCSLPQEKKRLLDFSFILLNHRKNISRTLSSAELSLFVFCGRFFSSRSLSETLLIGSKSMRTIDFTEGVYEMIANDFEPSRS